MHLLHRSESAGNTAVRVTAFAFVGACMLLFRGACFTPIANGQIQIENDRAEKADEDITSGVYLPTDRSLSRAIARARERLGQHEYHEALAFLHGILGREEDSFLERADDSREQLGLKAAARQLIRDLPPEGHDAYELLHGASARRQLEAAIRAGDPNAMAEVIRQFFHTAAGYEAALVLAQMEADQGHFLAAAQLYQQLIDSPLAAAQFDPQLSIAAALNYVSAGEPDRAASTLRALVERKASGDVKIAGKSAPLPGPTADPLEWLRQFAGKPSRVAPADKDWLTLHGDPARNARVPNGRPHLRPKWQVRVVNDPTIEAYLTDRNGDFIQRNVVAIPSARPIAVGDVVVMRTPENVVAVDWKSGKRIWETRDEGELAPDETPSELIRGSGQADADWIAQGKPLEERIWDDVLTMSLASDGQRVFVVRGASAEPEDEIMPWQVAPGFGRVGGEVSAATNQLVAYDLATQGKLLWELDGGRTTGPLVGAFFLGAPLAIDDTLFVMAEIRSAVYLLALDPASGNVRWQQQLVGLEQGIALDPDRRRVGATPSYADGLLICPTSASAVIAIDVVKREFAWVYRYPRELQTSTELRNLWQHAPQTQLPRVNDRWLDSAAIVAGGRVFLTPPESAELHCLDLHTGKQLWKHRQTNSLFIGAVDQGRVLLVGTDSIQGLRASDKAPAWDQETVPLPDGALASGQGYLSEGYYYLPLTSGQIAAIEMTTGKITNFTTAQPEISLGNLICYRGSVLSQSPLVLNKFEQLSVLKQRTDSALAANPDDPTALRDSAELKRADGQLSEALALLKRAFEKAPDDPVTQQMLVEQLLEAIASDYAIYRGDVSLVARLARDRDQQIELMRINADGLAKLAQRTGALDAYLRLADFTAEDPANLRIDANYQVRSDRWIAGQLGRLWADASPDERKLIAVRLAARRPTGTVQTTAELRNYLNHFDALESADEVRLSLARLLIDRSRSQEAEIELLKIIDSRHSTIRSEAAALMAKLLVNASSPKVDSSEAALSEAGSAQSASDGNAAAIRDWPRGRVEFQLIPATAQTRERTSRVPVDGQTSLRELRIEQDFWPSNSVTHWFVTTDCSQLVGRNNLGTDVFHLNVDQSNTGPQYRENNLVHGARLGRLLFVSLGGQIMAIDSQQDRPDSEGDLLWQASPLSPMSPDEMRGARAFTGQQTRSPRPVYHSWSSRKRVSGAASSKVGSLGPVTPRGVVFHQRDELRCVDPISGELLWVRTDVPTGCELFGDKEFVFAADVRDNVAYVIRLVDGELIGKREFSKYEWLVTAGRNIAQLGRGNRVLRVTDILSQEKLFEAEYASGSSISVVDPDAVAVYEPSGKFQLIDVNTGRVAIDQQLQPMTDLRAIYTRRSDDVFYVFVANQSQDKSFMVLGQSDYPLINGPVYAFSVQTGKPLWPSPAIVRNRGIVLAAPKHIPMLIFAERKTGRDPATGGGSQLRVLCLDKRTGQTLYRDDNLADTPNSRFRVRAEHSPKPMVALEMGAGKIQLTMTDLPRPPQPPANNDLEAPRENVERGLRGIGRKLGGALRGAIEVPGLNGKQDQQPPNQQNQPGGAQPPRPVPEIDDD